MLYLIFFTVSFLASVAGAICGIGGGVIIKPVLDATGLMEVGAISFLSGCTVLSMSAISVGKTMRSSEKVIEVRTGTPLALGAAVGGVVGKEIFQYVYSYSPDKNMVGAVQAFILLLITLLTLIYTINTEKVKTHRLESWIWCSIIGLFLGLLSAFLGIGGGPINLMVLAFFFSMTTKQAAANSLYIILFSQAASFVNTLVRGTVPDFPFPILVLMVIGGVLGGIWGAKVNKKFTDRQVSKLFVMLMLLIIGINIFNIYRFYSLI